MNDIVAYFSSNPEAVAALLIFAIGGLASIIAFGYSIFASYPLILRLLANRSLVYVDEVLRERVQVVFENETQKTEVNELRQIDVEILNSHPRSKSEASIVTINLPSSDVTILGVTTANSDNRTPSLGGRQVIARIEKVPIRPLDPMLGSNTGKTSPAVVVDIPYLDRVTKNDRIFLRITYDGPWLVPEVQGAESTTAWQYRRKQRVTWVLLLTILLFLGLASYSKSLVQGGIPLYHIELFQNPYHLVGIGLFLIAYISFLFRDFYYHRLQRYLRPFSSPLIPPPSDEEIMNTCHLYDAIVQSETKVKNTKN